MGLQSGNRDRDPLIQENGAGSAGFARIREEADAISFGGQNLKKNGNLMGKLPLTLPWGTLEILNIPLETTPNKVWDLL